MVEQNKQNQSERANEQPNSGRREGYQGERKEEDIEAKDVAQAMTEDTEEDEPTRTNE